MQIPLKAHLLSGNICKWEFYLLL